MSSDELADVLQLKESYIRSHWPRIVESYEKQNIKLYKLGRGAAATIPIPLVVRRFPCAPTSGAAPSTIARANFIASAISSQRFRN